MSHRENPLHSIFVEAMEAYGEMIELGRIVEHRWRVQLIRTTFAARVRELQGLPAKVEITIWRPNPYIRAA